MGDLVSNILICKKHAGPAKMEIIDKQSLISISREVGGEENYLLLISNDVFHRFL
jgi:hypothetical protein